MARHKDVEFHVDRSDGSTIVYKTFDEAAGIAVARSASTGTPVNIDVCIFSEAGARAYGGDDAVETYREDPDASVFERITVSATSRGRIR